ncbi:MAG: molybdenum cofactor biosynthesis protein [Desulfobulbus propionicus]|nr:MAG: molybdenum cofactor biosynthesis protein [Desulfobulbus propionicus]
MGDAGAVTQRFTCGVLTLSDKGARGERIDTSGKMLCGMLEQAGFVVREYQVLPDTQSMIEEKLVELVDTLQLDLIVTTGGTGVSPSDQTPEATRKVIDREVPGISEAMRAASLQKTVQAVWSRGIAGVRRHSLIINLPGSRKAARENLEAVLPALSHGLYKLQGGEADCGEEENR